MALLAVPRPVDPVDLPDPRVDQRAVERVRRADEALAQGADRDRLDVDVLELGSAIFAYGEADAAGDEASLARARARVLDAAARARHVGPSPILALRAHHLRSFLAEIRRFEQTGEESARLKQLAGGFTRMLRRSGWIAGLDEKRPRVLMDPTALEVAFKKRWNEITGIGGDGFEVTVDEARAFYRFLLLHPIAPPDQAGLPRTQEARAAAAAQYRLKKIDELAAVDPSYPRDLARGVVFYQMQRYPQAVEAFRRHLEARPDGPLTIRAQNYLRAALGRAREE